MSLRQELWLTKDGLNSPEDAIEWARLKLQGEFQRATEIRIMVNPVIKGGYLKKHGVTYTASIKGVVELVPNQ